MCATVRSNGCFRKRPLVMYSTSQARKTSAISPSTTLRAIRQGDQRRRATSEGGGESLNGGAFTGAASSAESSTRGGLTSVSMGATTPAAPLRLHFGGSAAKRPTFQRVVPRKNCPA